MRAKASLFSCLLLFIETAGDILAKSFVGLKVQLYEFCRSSGLAARVTRSDAGLPRFAADCQFAGNIRTGRRLGLSLWILSFCHFTSWLIHSTRTYQSLLLLFSFSLVANIVENKTFVLRKHRKKSNIMQYALTIGQYIIVFLVAKKMFCNLPCLNKIRKKDPYTKICLLHSHTAQNGLIRHFGASVLIGFDRKKPPRVEAPENYLLPCVIIGAPHVISSKTN